METHFLGKRAPLPRKLFSSGVNIKQISFIHAMSRERKKERKKEKKKKNSTFTTFTISQLFKISLVSIHYD